MSHIEVILVTAGLRAAFALCGLVGVALSVWVGRDAHRDLEVRRAAGINGAMEMSGRIARTNAYEVAMPLHIGFLALALVTALAPLPTGTPTLIRAVVAYALFVGIQVLVIRGQIRVIYWRHRVRHGPDPAHP